MRRDEQRIGIRGTRATRQAGPVNGRRPARQDSHGAVRRQVSWVGGCLLSSLVSVADAVSDVEVPALRVVGGAPITYSCGAAEIVARYYGLSDGSLEFVKVRLPGGAVVTLPRAVSASGARYTDDREYVFWNKGSMARVEQRDENGEWFSVYPECLEVGP